MCGHGRENRKLRRGKCSDSLAALFFGFELAAAGGDVDASALADGAGEACLLKDAVKGVGGGVGAFLTAVARGLIERDEIDVRIKPVEESGDLFGVLGCVIDSSDECPGEEDAPACLCIVAAAGGDELMQWPALIGWDECGAFLLRGGVKRDGEVVGPVFRCEAQDTWHDADGGDADLGGAEIDAAGVGDHGQRLHDGVVIVKRLAHAHEDEIAQSLATGSEGAARVMNLCDDFTGPQMPHKAHLARGTKNTAHGAAGLGADAGRVAPGVAHDDGLDLLAIRELEECFLSQSIAAGDVGGDTGRIEREGAVAKAGGQPALKRRREVGACPWVWDGAEVQCIPKGLRMRRAQSIRNERGSELVLGEVVKAGHGFL